MLNTPWRSWKTSSRETAGSPVHGGLSFGCDGLRRCLCALLRQALRPEEGLQCDLQ